MGCFSLSPKSASNRCKDNGGETPLIPRLFFSVSVLKSGEPGLLLNSCQECRSTGQCI